MAITGAVAFLNLFASISMTWNGLGFTASIDVWPVPSTVIEVPPFGKLSSRTHLAPVRVSVRLDSIDPDEAAKTISSLAEDPLRSEMLARAARSLLFRLAGMSVVVAFVGGGMIQAFSVSRSHMRVLAGALIGAATTLILLFSAYATFDETALSTPRYEGMLEAAPWMLSLVDKGLQSIEGFGSKMSIIADNLQAFSNRVEAISPIPEDGDMLQILHVTDIHNNPAAFSLIAQIVSRFDVDLIIDTGDITDLGSSLEAAVFKGIADLDIPYILIPGNHESPDTVQAMRKMPNVKVLDDTYLTVKGITIGGISDPASRSFSAEVVTGDERLKAVERTSDMLRGWPRLDILGIHNVAFLGEIRPSLVLTGHTHSPSIQNFEGQVVLNSGTSGGAGLRGLQVSGGVPMTMSVLYLQRAPADREWRPVAVDMIKVESLHSSFSLERVGLSPPSPSSHEANGITEATSMLEARSGQTTSETLGADAEPTVDDEPKSDSEQGGSTR